MTCLLLKENGVAYWGLKDVFADLLDPVVDDQTGCNLKLERNGMRQLTRIDEIGTAASMWSVNTVHASYQMKLSCDWGAQRSIMQRKV